jgi:hypothetical protein
MPLRASVGQPLGAVPDDGKEQVPPLSVKSQQPPLQFAVALHGAAEHVPGEMHACPIGHPPGSLGPVHPPLEPLELLLELPPELLLEPPLELPLELPPEPPLEPPLELPLPLPLEPPLELPLDPPLDVLLELPLELPASALLVASKAPASSGT